MFVCLLVCVFVLAEVSFGGTVKGMAGPRLEKINMSAIKLFLCLTSWFVQMKMGLSRICLALQSFALHKVRQNNCHAVLNKTLSFEAV